MSKRGTRRKSRIKGPHIYQRTNGMWYAALGNRERVSLSTTDRKEAETRFAKLLSEGSPELRRTAKAPEESLVAIATQYLQAPHGWTQRTAHSAYLRVKMVGSWFDAKGVKYASEITPKMVDLYFNERCAKVTHRTINRDWRTWRLMITWAMDRSLCGPCKAVTERNELREARRTKRRSLPSPEDIAKVLIALRSRDERAHDSSRKGMMGGSKPRGIGAASCVLTLYVTGLRIEELRRLRPDDLHNGVLWVRPEKGAATHAEPGKSHRERSIPLSREAQHMVHAYFTTVDGRTRSFSSLWLLKTLHNACKASGVPTFGLHDLRRCFATEAHRSGVPIATISMWLGHSNVQTTELYVGEYRKDYEEVAPLPRGVAVHYVCTKCVHSSPSESLLLDHTMGAENEKPAENAGFCERCGSDLNRRITVLQTVDGATIPREKAKKHLRAVH